MISYSHQGGEASLPKNIAIKVARAQKDMTQKALAEAVGVSRQTMNAIEKGEYNPTIRLCRKICRILDRSLDDLFWEDEEDEEYVTEKAPMTLPQLSVRLGIIVYGELILFPILIQIFSNLFESMDMQKVFATKDIFVLCIFTAFIWTIPLFYMYYNHKYTKKIIACCMLGEIIRILVYLPTFMKYYNSHEYSIRVFVFFILIDFIRLLILFVFAIHVLKSEQEYAPSPKN